MELTFEEVLAAVRPLRVTGGARAFPSVCTDSRTLQPGELFIALKGDRFDGADFIPQALERGSGGVICRLGAAAEVRAPVIEVEDPLAALGDMARAVRQKSKARVAAVTGSSGKTTVKELIAAMCQAHAPTAKNPSSFNNAIGLPLTLLAISGNERYIVLEMGMNHPGEIDYLAGIASPDVGVITNIGLAHVGLLGSLEAIARAKAELWRHLRPDGTAVIPGSDPWAARYARELTCRTITFGMEGQCDVRCEAQGREMIRASVMGREVSLPLPGPGPHACANLLAALATAAAMGVDPEAAAGYAAYYTPPPGRLQTLKASGGLTILDDSYNANPDSMRVALRVLRESAGRRKLAALGDMAELGDHAAQEHRAVGKAAAFVDFLFCAGEHAPQYAAGARDGGLSDDRIGTARDPVDLAAPLLEVTREGDVILVKGSRVTRMERIVALLMKEKEQEKPQ